MTHIRKQIERDVFDYQQLHDCLSEFSKPRDKILRLVADGEIERLKKGLYIFGEAYRQGPVSREQLANIIHGPSYISLDYALSYHGLIPEHVETVTSVTTGRSRSFETPFGNFSYRHMNATPYAEGINLEQIKDNSFLIASPEKALVDKIWADKRLHGIRMIDYPPYLFEDLRMDPDLLMNLNADRLHTIGQAYNSRKIDLLIRFLHSLRKQRDE